MRNRLTLVVSPKHTWSGTGLLFCDSLLRMRQAMAANDVVRIILDGCVAAEDFLHVLASLPGDILADVLSMRGDGGAYLSATGRGGDRVLYALSPADVHFYLEAHGLGAKQRLTRTA